MERYYMTARPEDIQVSQVAADPDEQRIFVGSPFLGFPASDIEGSQELAAAPILIIDLNIFNFIRNGKNGANVRALLEFSSQNGMELTPLVAVMEQHRSYAKPKRAFRQYACVLKREYHHNIGPAARKKLLEIFQGASPKVEENTRLMRDYLVLIKHFYHQKVSLEEKVRRFSELVVTRNLPMFSFAFLLGCVFYFVKDNRGLYSQEITSKVQSDMAYSPASEEERLWNVASDLMLYLSVVEIFRDRNTGERRFSFIASSDITTVLVLAELCHVMVVHNHERNFSHVSFRPSGKAGLVLDPILRRHQKPVDPPGYVGKAMRDPRRQNLAKVAEELKYRPE